MRPTYARLLALLTCLLMPAPGFAQNNRLRISSIRVGFMTSPGITFFKAGAWTPVYVELEAPSGRVNRGSLIIESVDGDDIRNRYTVSFGPLEAEERAVVIGYTKPGAASAKITVTAEVDGKTLALKEDDFLALELGQQIYLTVGARLPSLRRAIYPTQEQGLPEAEDEADPQGQNSQRRLAAITDVNELPKAWYAYEPINLLILTTGDAKFLTAFEDEPQVRKDALAEWVRRGGKLIVSVGRNQHMVSRMRWFQEVLPVSIAGGLQVPQLRILSGSQSRPFENLPPKNNPDGPRPPVELARLERKPGRELEVRLPHSEKDSPLLIVQGAYGLGSVTVVAFDLDQPPFSTWVPSAQKDFWLNRLDVKPPGPGDQNEADQQLQRARVRSGGLGTTTDLATQLQANLEKFDEVPVISFGWVALFILIYILIVGPLDYYFLKKVVKRLELTWITFPTVVITISVAAYFMAYWLKGNDQKINKIDLLDIDLATQQVYGNTWFTVFSPRIQHYTIGLQPSENGWGPPNQRGNAMMLSWMGRPETDWRGTNRQGSGGLFRRVYDYAPDATGMVGVPIPVWSSRSFSSAWRTPFDPPRPLISADIKHPPGNQPGTHQETLTGTITSHLPVALHDVVLYSVQGGSGRWYPLEQLLPDVPRRVDSIQSTPGKEMSTWLSEVTVDATRRATTGSKADSMGGDAATMALIKRLLFPLGERGLVRDNSLGQLDQSWRLGYKDEVILFGRIPRKEGNAEQIDRSPESPTHLWLGSLPGTGESRVPLVGTLAEETYVRVFIPVSSKP